MTPRDNPFNSWRIESLDYRFATGSWDTLLRRLFERGGRGAIVGPHGTGKTTLMEQLADRLTRLGLVVRHVRLESDDRGRCRRQLRDMARGAGPKDALLLDGAGLIGGAPWWRFRLAARRASVVVVTGHREGRLPLLCRTGATPELLHGLIDQLLGPGHPVTPARCRQLLAHCGGNVRRVFGLLYDRWSVRAGAQKNPVDALCLDGVL